MPPETLKQFIRNMAGERNGADRPPKLEPMIATLKKCDSPFGFKVMAGDWFLVRHVCHEIDEEVDGHLAWCMIEDVTSMGKSDNRHLMTNTQEAVVGSLQESTVGYFDRRPQNGVPYPISTGVLVQCGGRLLVATTSHSVYPDTANRLVFIPPQLVGEDDHTVSILRSTWDCRRDVACVELEANATHVLVKTPIPLSRIDPGDIHRPGFTVIVAGYPVETRRRVDPSPIKMPCQLDDKIQGFALPLMSSMSRFIPTVDWDVLQIPNHADRPNPTHDVFFPWPEGPGEVTSSNRYFPDELCAPNGMSGGGFWQAIKSEVDGVWMPDRFHLCAIQSSWWSAGQYLRGTQIVHWLNLIWTAYPDLRDTLRGTFPQTAFAAIDFEQG